MSKSYMHTSVHSGSAYNSQCAEEPKCPLTDECMKNVQYICTVKHYLAIKKNAIIPFAAMWMDLEIIRLSQVRETHMSYDITFMWNQKKKNTNELTYKIVRKKTNLWLPKGLGGRDKSGTWD